MILIEDVCSVCVEDTAVTTGEVVILIEDVCSVCVEDTVVAVTVAVLIEDGMDVSVMATNYNIITIYTS